MELKHLYSLCVFSLSSSVLIVPSGIETWFQDRPHTYRYVLIVPSGIETGLRVETTTAVKVLIVPSGIET